MRKLNMLFDQIRKQPLPYDIETSLYKWWEDSRYRHLQFAYPYLAMCEDVGLRYAADKAFEKEWQGTLKGIFRYRVTFRLNRIAIPEIRYGMWACGEKDLRVWTYWRDIDNDRNLTVGFLHDKDKFKFILANEI